MLIRSAYIMVSGSVFDNSSFIMILVADTEVIKKLTGLELRSLDFIELSGNNRKLYRNIFISHLKYILLSENFFPPRNRFFLFLDKTHI